MRFSVTRLSAAALGLSLALGAGSALAQNAPAKPAAPAPAPAAPAQGAQPGQALSPPRRRRSTSSRPSRNGPSSAPRSRTPARTPAPPCATSRPSSDQPPMVSVNVFELQGEDRRKLRLLMLPIGTLLQARLPGHHRQERADRRQVRHLLPERLLGRDRHQGGHAQRPQEGAEHGRRHARPGQRRPVGPRADASTSRSRISAPPSRASRPTRRCSSSSASNCSSSSRRRPRSSARLSRQQQGGAAPRPAADRAGARRPCGRSRRGACAQAIAKDGQRRRRRLGPALHSLSGLSASRLSSPATCRACGSGRPPSARTSRRSADG